MVTVIMTNSNGTRKDPLDAQIVPPPKVEFTDPVLEDLVRKSLNRPGSLTTRELKELTVFEVG